MNNKSAILLFLSDYKEKRGHGEDEEDYLYIKEDVCNHDSGKRINRRIGVKGAQTNDAPIETLMEITKQDGTVISRIFCIVTWDVFTRPILENASVSGMTQFLRFKERVLQRCPYEADLPQFVPIFEFDSERVIKDGHGALLNDPEGLRNVYGNEAEDLMISNTDEKAFHVYRQLAAVMRNLAETDMYIDYTGGFRDTNLLMVTVIRYLEFSGIHCKDIIYSQYINGAQTHPIHDIKYIYDMLRMIDGVNEFISSGSVITLTTFYQSNTTLQDPQVGQAMDSLSRFSDAIRICDLEEIGQALVDIERDLSVLEKDSYEDMGIFSSMFRSLIPQLRAKMHLPAQTEAPSGKPADIYPRLIQWTTENLLLQQAITLYVEKMPLVYLYQDANHNDDCICQQWFPEYMRQIAFNNMDDLPSDTENEKKKKKKIREARRNGEAKFFYEEIFDSVGDQYDVNNQALTSQFCSEIRDILNHCQTVSPGNVKHIIWHRKAQGQYSGQMDTAMDRVCTCVDHWNNSGAGLSSELVICEKQVTGSLYQFLNSTATNAKKYQRYLLFGENPSGKYDATLPKKLRSLKILKEQISSQSSPHEAEKIRQLYLLMKYYFALKLIRNRSDHASEKAKTHEEREAEEYLLNDGLDQKDSICINMKADNVQSIILRGLAITNSI